MPINILFLFKSNKKKNIILKSHKKIQSFAIKIKSYRIKVFITLKK